MLSVSNANDAQEAEAFLLVVGWATGGALGGEVPRASTASPRRQASHLVQLLSLLRLGQGLAFGC